MPTSPLTEAGDTLVIGDQRTRKLDRCGYQQTIRRIALLEMMQLIGTRSRSPAQGYRLYARALKKTLDPCLDREIEINPPQVDK